MKRITRGKHVNKRRRRETKTSQKHMKGEEDLNIKGDDTKEI